MVSNGIQERVNALVGWLKIYNAEMASRGAELKHVEPYTLNGKQADWHTYALGSWIFSVEDWPSAMALHLCLPRPARADP